MKNGLHVEYGDKKWYRNDKLHREDGPAIEEPDGSKMWYRDGKLHREDGPAVESLTPGSEFCRGWYINGERHREDGPAIETEKGGKVWYKNGEIHREDGPALENMVVDRYDGGPAMEWDGITIYLDDFEGEFSWWIYGELHRKDGPAVEMADGTEEWWIHGRELSKDEIKMRTDGASEEDLDLMSQLGLFEGKILDYMSFKKYI
jgi:hypothetical protein